MSHSLRAKIKGLRYKGIITDKDCDRLRKALDNEDVLDKIRAEIEGNMESIIGKYDSSIPKFNMPSYKIERNKTREECISIIDRYREVSE